MPTWNLQQDPQTAQDLRARKSTRRTTRKASRKTSRKTARQLHVRPAA